MLEKLKNANKVRREKAFNTRYFLYEFINKHKGLTIYELARKLDWTTGKVEHHIKKLLKDGVVRNTEEIVNGRLKKAFFPTSWKEFIDWNEVTNFKPEDFKDDFE